jgi:hypothetical protein
MWASLSAVGIMAFLCACAPSHPPATAGRAAPADGPPAANHEQTARYYGSPTDPRPRHRPMARRLRHHYEAQQARADSVNPPFGAGE